MRHPAMVALLFVFVMSCSSTPTQPAPKVSLLYVQTAGSGSFEPVAGSTNKYRLVLNDVSPSVVYFSDRPNRLAGHVSTAEFLEEIGFGGALDPNAAIDIEDGAAESDLIVAALTKPAYDVESGTLSYEVTVLDTPREGLAVFTERMDRRLPTRFGSVALFIDDAPCPISCTQYGRCCPGKTCVDLLNTGAKRCMR